MHHEYILVKCPECGEFIDARFLDHRPWCSNCGLIFEELERLQDEARRIVAEAANFGKAS